MGSDLPTLPQNVIAPYDVAPCASCLCLSHLSPTRKVAIPAAGRLVAEAHRQQVGADVLGPHGTQDLVVFTVGTAIGAGCGREGSQEPSNVAALSYSREGPPFCPEQRRRYREPVERMGGGKLERGFSDVLLVKQAFRSIIPGNYGCTSLLNVVLWRTHVTKRSLFLSVFLALVRITTPPRLAPTSVMHSGTLYNEPLKDVQPPCPIISPRQLHA